jgi:ferredoxin
MRRWFAALSTGQRTWLFMTAVVMLLIVGLGFVVSQDGEQVDAAGFSVDMSISEIAPSLSVTGKALARELKLPIDVPKQKPLATLDVSPEQLHHTVEHLLSHTDSMLKYYLYAALVLGGLVFLSRLGRPDNSGIERRRGWYPREPYILFLMISAIAAGFLLGKSPNPMEGVVKVFKSMVGLYPDPVAKTIAFVFFIALAIAGNKMICGWACPFGALQELVYSIPVLGSIKRRKIPFGLTNTIRAALFVAALLFLFGVVGGQRGMVVYHYVNPFNLFIPDVAALSVLLTIIVALLGSLFMYRPFCQLVCPFGLTSWIAERLSIIRVRIDREKCTQCGACIRACPLEAAKGRVEGGRLKADCFSCARCLNVCPVDAVHYESVFARGAKPRTEETPT